MKKFELHSIKFEYEITTRITSLKLSFGSSIKKKINASTKQKKKNKENNKTCQIWIGRYLFVSDPKIFVYKKMYKAHSKTIKQ